MKTLELLETLKDTFTKFCVLRWHLDEMEKDMDMTLEVLDEMIKNLEKVEE